MPRPTRDRELLALALHIERCHGADGPRVIAEKIAAFALAGEPGAVELWHGIAGRYERLLDRGSRTIATAAAISPRQ